MDPQQQQQQQQQQPAAPTYTPTPVPGKAPGSGRKKLALVLLIAPTALLILTFILFAISNFISSSSTPAAGELFPEPSIGTTVINVLLFCVGALGVVSWLPGIIVGIVLLATPPKQ